MSATSTTAVVRSHHSSHSNPRSRSSYLIFVLCATAYLVPFMLVLLPGSDEGTLIYGALRVAHGQVFARDFFEVIGPGTFYWMAAFFKLFGTSFAAMRLDLFTTSLGTAVTMFFLSRRISHRFQTLPIVLLASTSCGDVWPGMSHHVDSNFLALLAVACMILWWDRRANFLLSLAGAMAALTTATLQPKGIYLLCVFVVWLIYQGRKKSIAHIAYMAVGYFTVIAIVVVYFWHQGALASLVHDNFVWPSRHYSSANTLPYASFLFSSHWDHWVGDSNRYPWMIPLAAILMVPFLFIAALPCVLAIAGTRLRRKLAQPEILLYLLGGAAVWFAESHRMDIVHLVFGSPLLLTLCIGLMTEFQGKFASFTLQSLFVTAGSLLFFNLVCLSLAARSTNTRAGVIRMINVDPVITYLDKHTRRDEEIFVYPYSPADYFLSATTNPTPYSILVYRYNTPSQFQETLHILEQNKVRYIVWDTKFLGKMHLFFPGVVPPRPEELIIEPYFESHYKLVWEQDGVRIMERL